MLTILTLVKKFDSQINPLKTKTLHFGCISPLLGDTGEWEGPSGDRGEWEGPSGDTGEWEEPGGYK